MVQAKYQNKVRIIGGRWRGRRIEFASVPGLRPTKDFIRETVFNWLAPSIAGSRCLDLFAGSGVLGFEAASRGASEVVLVENNPFVIQGLEAQKQLLDATQVKIVAQSAQRYIQNEKNCFDIIFLDPPFAQGVMTEMLLGIKTHNVLTPNGRIYIELPRSSAAEDIFAQWPVLKNKTMGAVCYALLGVAF